MRTKRPTTRAERRAKKPASLPQRFEPRFLDTDADNRQRVVKLIRRRLERLKEEAGCDSFQKELLAEQAIFISVQLETMKVNALEGKPFDAGSFTQMANALSGLLSKIGLSKSAKQVIDLKSYVAKVAKK